MALRDNFFKSLEENFKVSMLRALETLDPSPVQHALIKKWKHVQCTQKVTEAKRDLDNYYRHIKVLEEAFEHLHEASGIMDLQDIVTSIIKTREQHSSLYSHMNTLLAEIDVLEEVLGNAKSSIDHQREARESGKRKALQIKADLKTQVSTMVSYVSSKSGHLSKVKDQLSQTFTAIKLIAALFSAEEFQDIMVTRFSQDDKVSHETVLSYLAEVDAGVSSLLMWLAYIRGERSSQMASVQQGKSFENLASSVKGLIAGLNAEHEADEVRVPLRENEIRRNAKMMLEQKFQQSYSTLTSTTSRNDPKRRALTPH